MSLQRCKCCGWEFEAARNQIFCSQECIWYGRKDANPEGKPAFTCAKCGRLVVVDEKHDRRTRFCSAECEKRYWRHPPHEQTTQNINFKSIKRLRWWENKTNV